MIPLQQLTDLLQRQLSTDRFWQIAPMFGPTQCFYNRCTGEKQWPGPPQHSITWVLRLPGQPRHAEFKEKHVNRITVMLVLKKPQT